MVHATLEEIGDGLLAAVGAETFWLVCPRGQPERGKDFWGGFPVSPDGTDRHLLVGEPRAGLDGEVVKHEEG